MTDAHVDGEVSAALVAYLGRGRSAAPLRDAEACRSSAAHSDPDDLLARVVAIVDDTTSTTSNWTDLSLAEGGRLAEGHTAARYPDLSDTAVAALAWSFTYDWR